MTAKDKIERLTNQWYGAAAFYAALTLLMNGIGFFTLLFTGCSLVFSIALTWFLGRRLVARSSLTRVVLVVFSFIGIVLGTIGTFKAGWDFLGQWSFQSICILAAGIAGLTMNVRSYRTLRDKSVQAYFA